tara:strand:+ start:8135 stop:8416 length:282 start_codon:yes stop_codon:yes gene_type:complete
MKVKELMERAGIKETGRALAYIKDALEEINTLSETHVTTSRIDLEKDKRFYNIPKETLKITDIRAKNHLNSKDEYRSIPRMVYEPINKDGDGI